MRNIKTKTISCPTCEHHGLDLGRAIDGRRAYRCQQCGNVWTRGLHGRKQTYSNQRLNDQFYDTGATNQKQFNESVDCLINELKG